MTTLDGARKTPSHTVGGKDEKFLARRRLPLLEFAVDYADTVIIAVTRKAQAAV